MARQLLALPNRQQAQRGRGSPPRPPRPQRREAQGLWKLHQLLVLQEKPQALLGQQVQTPKQEPQNQSIKALGLLYLRRYRLALFQCHKQRCQE